MGLKPRLPFLLFGTSRLSGKTTQLDTGVSCSTSMLRVERKATQRVYAECKASQLGIERNPSIYYSSFLLYTGLRGGYLLRLKQLSTTRSRFRSGSES